MPESTFCLITALRYDRELLSAPFNTSTNNGVPTPFLLLPYHIYRLRSAAALHGGDWIIAAQNVTAESFEQSCTRAVDKHDGDGPFKVRFALAIDGKQEITVSPVPTISNPRDPFHASSLLPDPLDHPPFELFLDNVPTSASIYTRTKTTRRAHYDAARARHSIVLGAPADVLLFDANERISETSIRNVAFSRDGRWITPADVTGCLEGVVRRWLIERGHIVPDEEGRLTRDTIEEGDVALVFNAVEGCRLAVVRRVGS